MCTQYTSTLFKITKLHVCGLYMGAGDQQSLCSIKVVTVAFTTKSIKRKGFPIKQPH